MAFLFVFGVLNEREKKLMSVWDRNNPSDILNDREVIKRYRISRRYPSKVAGWVKDDIVRSINKSKAIPAVIQVSIIIIKLSRRASYAIFEYLHRINYVTSWLFYH